MLQNPCQSLCVEIIKQNAKKSVEGLDTNNYLLYIKKIVHNFFTYFIGVFMDTDFKAEIENWKVSLNVENDTELAAKIGVTAASISNWRTGKSKPTRNILKLIDLLSTQKKTRFHKLAQM